MYKAVRTTLGIRESFKPRLRAYLRFTLTAHSQLKLTDHKTYGLYTGDRNA